MNKLRTRIAMKVIAPILVAAAVFGCAKKPEPERAYGISNSVVIANLQQNAEGKLPDGSVRFKDSAGGTYSIRDGQNIGEFILRARVSITPVENSGLTEVRFDDPTGKSPPAFTKVVDCKKPQ
ncbi:hypothetical protein HY988_01555 [Candidatus Micrarchaeota archaeon]|nr:hypothetical protein [Candidatus Micrarchaeota archaeon]